MVFCGNAGSGQTLKEVELGFYIYSARQQVPHHSVKAICEIGEIDVLVKGRLMKREILRVV